MLTTSKKQAVYQLMQQRIKEGVYPPGSRLPNEPELAAELGVSRLTLRPVLAQLEIENRLLRIKGKGTFIKEQESFSGIHILSVFHATNFAQRSLLLQQFQKAAAQFNAVIDIAEPMIIQSLSDNELRELFRKKQFGGILYLNCQLESVEPLRPIWKKLNAPMALINLYPDFGIAETGSNCSLIDCDVPGMLKDALGFLANRGHKKVLLVMGGNTCRIPEEKIRAILRECGLSGSSNLWQSQLDSDRIPLEKFLENSLNQPDRPSAICCGSSFFTARVYRFLKDRKIVVPEQVSVITVGNPPLDADLLRPVPTSVFCDYLELAKTALEQLMGRIVPAADKPFELRRQITMKNYVFERESVEYKK